MPQAPPLLSLDDMTFLDQLLGLDPREDPRVKSGELRSEDLDLLAERMWLDGVAPTTENAGPYLERLRSELEGSLSPESQRALSAALWAQEVQRAIGAG